MLIANSMNICFDRFTEVDLLPRMAAAGYAGVDFNFWDLIRRLDWHNPAEADPWLDELAGAASAAGLTWVQGHGPVFSLFAESDDDRFQRDLAVTALRACGQLGVPWLVMHPSTIRIPPDDSAQLQQLIEVNVDYFRSLLPACEQYGVGIAIENITGKRAEYPGVERSPGSTAEQLTEMIDALDHPLVGACWDTGHAQLTGLDQRANLVALGSRLKVLHLHENDGQHDLHLLPFTFQDATNRWNDIMTGLRQAGYAGDLTLEVAASFRAVPDALYDDLLRYSVQIGRQLVKLFEKSKVSRFM
ncbi:MAG: sugar phosphate isomerase/epimerase family protein [Armatimonadota bacterium]